MKRLILQVDVKIQDHTGFKRYEPVESLYKISEHQASKFANKWNVDYLKITDCNFLPEKHPIYQRLKMFDLNYDQILYLDMDAVILPICPNVFELFADHSFSAVRNYDWDKKEKNGRLHIKYENFRKELCDIYEANSDYRPFCSGVMLVRRDFLDATRNMWRQYLNTFDVKGERDQGIYNKLVVNLGGKYNELDENWGAWYKSGKYIDHLGGPFRKHDFNASEYILKNNIDMNIKSKFEDFYT